MTTLIPTLTEPTLEEKGAICERWLALTKTLLATHGNASIASAAAAEEMGYDVQLLRHWTNSRLRAAFRSDRHHGSASHPA